MTQFYSILLFLFFLLFLFLFSFLRFFLLFLLFLFLKIFLIFPLRNLILLDFLHLLPLQTVAPLRNLILLDFLQPFRVQKAAPFPTQLQWKKRLINQVLNESHSDTDRHVLHFLQKVSPTFTLRPESSLQPLSFSLGLQISSIQQLRTNSDSDFYLGVGPFSPVVSSVATLLLEGTAFFSVLTGNKYCFELSHNYEELTKFPPKVAIVSTWWWWGRAFFSVSTRNRYCFELSQVHGFNQ